MPEMCEGGSAIRALRPIGAVGFGAGAFVERCEVRLRDRKDKRARVSAILGPLTT
jgi:hypothetical protein